MNPHLLAYKANALGCQLSYTAKDRRGDGEKERRGDFLCTLVDWVRVELTHNSLQDCRSAKLSYQPMNKFWSRRVDLHHHR